MPHRLPTTTRLLFAALLSAALLTGCASRVPITPGAVPEPSIITEEDEAYGHEVLSELVDRYPLDTNDARINRVRDIVDDIAANGKLGQDPWHVYVLVDDQFKNAAATRGNYIFIWTGMLNVVKNDQELATVLSHEIGHVLAGHTFPTPDEQVQEMIGGVAGVIASGVVGAQGAGFGGLGDLAGQLVQAVVNAALVNPESQRKELEADVIGLFLMADAGYDPQAAVELWERVKDDPDFSSSIEFLSTHPSTTERVEALRLHLPEALERYRRGAKAPPQTKTPKTPAKKTTLPVATPKRTSYRVLEADVPVYREDDLFSERIATLPAGQKVDAAKIDDGWLKLEEPVQGYAREYYFRRNW